MGSLSGLVTVFIGAAGPLIAPFFIDRDLTKENIVATKAACQAIGHLGKMPIFIYFFDVNYLHHWSVLLPLIFAVYCIDINCFTFNCRTIIEFFLKYECGLNKIYIVTF